MTPPRLVVALAAALASAGLPACVARVPPAVTSASAAPAVPPVQVDLDRILEAPALAGALVAVHIETLRDHRVVYSRNATSRVIPASVLKIVTAAAAADRLGWAHRFETRLEAAGPIVDGVLQGDLIVVGGGDPAINAQDLMAAPLFEEWAEALHAAGIRRVDGRLIGDDTAFDDEPLGAGWAWDYLTATYAAPSGALSYNENLVAVRVAPGPTAGEPAAVTINPPGHGLVIRNEVITAPAGTAALVALERLPGSATLWLRGQVPHGGADVIRATTAINPTTFFVEGLRVTLATHGIAVRGGAHDIDELPAGSTTMPSRRLVATHLSPPLSAVVAQMMKTSQNYYGEMLIKAVGRTAADAAGIGSTERGRQVIRQTLERWTIPDDMLVMHDGSGLSRYNYVNARLVTDILRRMWEDDAHRGPFAAALPVGGHDGTLGARMTDSLRRRVQAKTGTISNVRSLAGYAETIDGEKIAFTMIANHFVAPNAEIDAVMETVLTRVISGAAGAVGPD